MRHGGTSEAAIRGGTNIAMGLDCACSEFSFRPVRGSDRNDTPRRPSVLVVDDSQMPRMDGCELARRLGSIVPVIMVTAEDLDRVPEGVVKLFRKPVDVSILEEWLGAALPG